MSGNRCGANCNYGNDSYLVDGTVGVSIRHRKNTTAQFMEQYVTQLSYQQYNYNEVAIKSLLLDRGHIAFREATVQELQPYFMLAAHMGERDLVTLRPKDKNDRASIEFYNPAVSNKAPKQYVRTPSQVGVNALASLKETLVTVGNQHSTTKIPTTHMLAYLPSPRPLCIATHDDHGGDDFDAQGFFDKHVVRFNCFLGMLSTLVIEMIGYRVNEHGEEKQKKFGECSWDLGSSGFYAFDSVGSGRHGIYSIVDPETNITWLICFKHGVVKREDASPTLTARSVFCVDLTMPTQTAATALVRSVATEQTIPVSISFDSDVDLSSFGTTLDSGVGEITRIIRTLIPFEEKHGRTRCRSCQEVSTLVDTRPFGPAILIGDGNNDGWNMFDMCNVGSAVREVEDGIEGLVGVISGINTSNGSVGVTYVLTSGDRVTYTHDPRTLRPATDAERVAVLGERTDQPNVDYPTVFQSLVCYSCAVSDGETQDVTACKTCHREPTLGDLAQCIDCGDYHCSGFLRDNTRHFLCSNTGSGIKLTKATQGSVKKIATCVVCRQELERLLDADAKGRSTVMRTVAWGMQHIAEVIARSELGQHGLFLNGEPANITTIRAHVKGRSDRIATICNSLEANFLASNGQDQINNNETMNKAFGGQGPGSPATIEYKRIDQL